MHQAEQSHSDEDCFPTQVYNNGTSDDENENNNAWAKLSWCLLTNNHNYHWIEKDVFVAGRQSTCDYQFTNAEHKTSIYPLISKMHFVIEKRVVRGVDVAYIKDVSSNGTFINDELIGNNKSRVLSNGDVISIGKIGYRIFSFSYAKRHVELIPIEAKLEYFMVNKIGKGGFGDVYYVLHKKTCEPFAMKVISINANIRESRDVFIELKVLQSVKHKNIVAFHDSIMKDNLLFLILEFMPGGDLAQLLARKKRLSESVTRHIFHQVTLGVDFLHSERIVHRDIKPLNILLSNQEEYPVVKITDFGLSKKLKKFVSAVKEIVGTPAYRAPELRGRLHQICDTRVDVWSLGVLLYYCLSGKLPFENESRNPTNVLNFAPLHVWYHISLPPKLIIKKSLEINFQDRPFCHEILLSQWFKTDVENDRLEAPMKRLKTT